MSILNNALIGELEATSQLGVTPAALRKWRRTGQGPAYAKLGASVRYKPDDITAWVAACTVKANARKSISA